MKRRRFRHLSWNDRLKIEAMLKAGRHYQEIADEIGVHLRTIYNEVKRGRYIHTNSDLTEEERYSPDIAEAAYREHLAAKGPDLKIGNDHELAQYIEKKIGEEGYSPAARRKGNRTKVYYCHPYSSYERGSNENANKLIRRWFPKGTDFRQVTAKAIQWVEDWINNYPREIHGFRSANSVFTEGVAMLILNYL